MVYRDLFVVSVKCDGKILREQKDKIYIPFGREYSIFLKNLNSKRAAIDVEIDGKDILDGTSLLIDANESFDLEGFLDGNSVSHKFKFIEKTQEISNFRGNRAEDGLIRVQYRFEKEQDPYRNIKELVKSQYKSYTMNSGIKGSMLRGHDSEEESSSSEPSYSSYSEEHNQSNDQGITVKGSCDSCQRFKTMSAMALETEIHTIIIQLVGGEKMITVKDKLQCENCGKMSRSHHKFCTNCGTSLY